jgi:hypothetical protein
MTLFKQGDRVRIRYAGRQVDGIVALASSNGRSLALEFEAMLGNYLRMMLVIESAGGFVDLIKKRRVELERLPDSPIPTQEN